MEMYFRAPGHPGVGLGSDELAATGREKRSLALVGFIVERTRVLASTLKGAISGGQRGDKGFLSFNNGPNSLEGVCFLPQNSSRATALDEPPTV